MSLLRARSPPSVLSVFAPRIATLVMFSTATLGRIAGALPTWVVIVSYVAGIAEFVNVTISKPTLYVFPAWIALVSVVLLVRRPDVSKDVPLSFTFFQPIFFDLLFDLTPTSPSARRRIA